MVRKLSSVSTQEVEVTRCESRVLGMSGAPPFYRGCQRIGSSTHRGRGRIRIMAGSHGVKTDALSGNIAGGVCIAKESSVHDSNPFDLPDRTIYYIVSYISVLDCRRL